MEERQYDLIFICRPDTPEADVDKVIATLESTAAEKGAKIESVAKWGRKRMAYRVQKLHEGYFVYMVIKTTHGEVVKELERRLKVADPGTRQRRRAQRIEVDHCVGRVERIYSRAVGRETGVSAGRHGGLRLAHDAEAGARDGGADGRGCG